MLEDAGIALQSMQVKEGASIDSCPRSMFHESKTIVVLVAIATIFGLVAVVVVDIMLSS
jgi:hypothetical protein